MLNRQKFSLLVLGLFGIGSQTTIVNCTPDPRPGQDVSTVTIPTDKLWTEPEIVVCWENTSYQTNSYRAAVEDYVTSQFQQTPLKLIGWSACDSSEFDISLFIYDDPAIETDSELQALKAVVASEIAVGHPRVRAWGKQLRAFKAGVVLTVGFEDSFREVQDTYNSLTPQGQEFMRISVALHEFGHAVGLRHEDAHSEKTCLDFSEDLVDGVEVTGYNPDSFMSRCFYRRLDYNLGPLALNAKDIEGLKTAYRHLQQVKSP